MKLAEAVRTTRDPSQNLTPAMRDVLLRIQSEYREMPGLSLTAPQAQRLWGLDQKTCSLALATLVERRALKQTRSGRSARASVG